MFFIYLPIVLLIVFQFAFIIMLASWGAFTSWEIFLENGPVMLIILLLAGVGIHRLFMFLGDDEIPDGILMRILYCLCIPSMILPVTFSLLKKLFNIKNEEDKFSFYFLSLITIVFEIMLFIVAIDSGFNDLMSLMFNGGIFLVILFFVIGVFVCKNFAPIERKNFFDWLLFLLCTPMMLFALLVAIFAKGVYEWAKTPLPQSSTAKKNTKYRVSTDLAGTPKIYDGDGNEVTGVDFVNYDGAIYGKDGNKYEPKNH